MCVLDEDLEKLFKTYKGTDRQKERIVKHIKEVVLRQFLQLIATKCCKLIPDMVEYFDVLYKSGEWEFDKKTLAKQENGGIETNQVRLDKFLI